MSKEFNITGTCIPDMHYMVDTSDKIKKVFKLVEGRKYFTINRPRQYGKTTTIYLLKKYISQHTDYLVLSISFEGIADESFREEKKFIDAFLYQFVKFLTFSKEKSLVKFIKENSINTFEELDLFITELMSESGKKIILMIDEVDKSSNNALFLNFIGLLRNKYLLQNQGLDLTFHSVILAGVHDVKTLKLKIRSEEEHKYNSPWNIAVNFDIDLSFSSKEIQTMLAQYMEETNIKMDKNKIGDYIYFYTSGYPFLVSRICKYIDEVIMLQEDNKKDWDIADIDKAVKVILREQNTNFESLVKNLENNAELYELVFKVIMEGAKLGNNLNNPIINLGVTYGVFKRETDSLEIHNRLYAQLIYDYMSSKMETSTNMYDYNFRDNFITKTGDLDFEKILLKFQEFMKKEYSHRDEEFLERHGRLLFLGFIKPIINGKGFDFKEVQISEEKRLDVVVTYENKKYVIEMKGWRGPEAHKKGLNQLKDYLDILNLDKGFLLIFDFTKSGQKEWKQENFYVEGKEIFGVWS